MNQMNNNINELIEEIDRRRQVALDNNVYSMFNSKRFLEKYHTMSYDQLEMIFELYDDFDSGLQIPLGIGNFIEDKILSDDFTIGIHRTALPDSFLESENVYDIMKNGLINYGHSMQGAISRPDINLTVSLFKTMDDAVPMLKRSYKGSTGSFVLLFPSSICKRELSSQNVNELYDNINGTLYIKPEYILGYIDNTDGMKFISRDEYLNYKNSISK